MRLDLTSMALTSVTLLACCMQVGIASEVLAQQTIWTCDDGENWSVGSSSLSDLKPVSLDIQRAVLLITAQADTRKYVVPLYVRQPAASFPAGSIHTITFTCEITTGSVGLRPIIVSKGKELALPTRIATAENGTLTWTLPDDFVNANANKAQDGQDSWEFKNIIIEQEANAEGTVAIDTVTVNATMNAAQAVAIVPDPQQAFGLVELGSGPAQLQLTNRSDTDITGTFSGTSDIWQGDQKSISLEVSLKPGEQRLISVDDDHSLLGLRQLTWTFTVDQDSQNGHLRWARHQTPVRPPMGDNGFYFSVCSHTERFGRGDRRQEFDLVTKIGATFMRLGINWDRMDNNGTLDWSLADEMLTEMRVRNIDANWLVCYSNPSTLLPKYIEQIKEVKKSNPEKASRMSWTATPTMASWSHFINELSTRYKGKIRYYEIWNEPDLEGFFCGTTDEYIDLLNKAGQVIHRNDPQAKVITGGYATLTAHGGRRLNPDLMRRSAIACADNYDVLGFHQHGPFYRTFLPIVDGELTDIRNAIPGQKKPLYFTETAVSTKPGGELEQAVELTKKLTFAYHRGAIGFTWYDLRNDGNDLNNSEHNFGLVTKSFRPKMNLGAFANCATLLRGMQPGPQLDIGAGRFAFTFSDGSSSLMLTWTEPFASSVAPIAFTCQGQAEIVDLMGNATPLRVVDGCTVITVGATPQWVRFTAAQPPTALGPILDLGTTPFLIPGRDTTLTAAVSNPTGTEKTITLTWSAADIGSVQATATLAPLAKQTCEPRIYTPKTIQPNAHHAIDGQLTWNMEPGGWSGTFPLQHPLATILGSKAADKRAPDFTINDQEHIHPFFAYDPGKEHLNWKGPTDLSAKVWLYRDGDSLVFRGDVCDDLHFAEKNRSQSWQGDGMQVGLQIPGIAGYWELGLAESGFHVYSAPHNLGLLSDEVAFTYSDIPDGKRYEARISLRALGLKNTEALFRFSCIANDDDGEGRESFLFLTPGIGTEKNTEAFLPVLLE